ncbi:MAG: hypothetical protein GY750_14870 [Lentisphaerae bacterium]|nr:hypothetical protein [Lentisphaerota bacterium]
MGYLVRLVRWHWNSRCSPGMILLVFLFAGCQGEQAGTETTQTKPVEYVFDKSISEGGKILCAASSGRKQRLDFVAFRVEASDRDGGRKSKLEPLGSNKECDLSKLSYSGLEDFSLARNDAVFADSATFRLAIKSHKIVPQIHVSRFAENMDEDIKFEIENLGGVCATVTNKTNEYGFKLIKSIDGCNKSVKYMQSWYTFAGINQTETIPAIITCTKPSDLYPDGTCFLKTWYKSYPTQIFFSAAKVMHWRQIRKQVFNVMDRHLVALISSFHCIGKFCKKIGRD